MARQDLEGQVGGGGYSDFEFVVTDAWFGISEAMKEKTGQSPIFLHWVGTTTMEDVPSLDEAGFHPSFSLGTDWEVTNDGKSVKYLGSSKNPRLGKWYGRMLGEMFEFTKDVPEGQHPFDGDNHPRDAANWIGTKWFMQDKPYEFKGGGNFEDTKTTHLMPTEYLGKVDISTIAPVAATAPVSATATAPAADVDPALLTIVETLAKNAPDYATFQKEALAVPNITSSPALVLQIADPNGLFASARG